MPPPPPPPQHAHIPLPMPFYPGDCGVRLPCMQYLPPRTCKLLLGHKADLPAYVVNDEALSLYVKRASGFRGWCLTVGSSEYGDYDVAARLGQNFPRTFSCFVSETNCLPLLYTTEMLTTACICVCVCVGAFILFCYYHPKNLTKWGYGTLYAFHTILSVNYGTDSPRRTVTGIYPEKTFSPTSL